MVQGKPKKLKILYLATGGSIHDYRFLVKLAERGYDACYAYLEPAGAAYAVDGVSSCYLGVKPHAPEETGDGGDLAPSCRFRRSLFEPFKRLLQRPAETVLCRRYLERLKALLREFKPDILHAGWVLDAGFTAALSGYRPLLLMPWGSDILLYPGRSRFYRERVRYALRRSAAVTCDAEEVKRRIMELAGYPEERIVVFPWGIDLDLFRPNPLMREQARRELGWSDKRIILMTRSLMPVYGIEYFIRALPQVLRDFPETRVLFIGDGLLRGELTALAAELGLEGKVRFLGAVANRELPRYLNAADLYVSSSLSDGSSLSLMEALACALPVVVTDVPAILEWIEEGVNGLVVPRKNTQRLAGAIVDMLGDEGAMRRMGRANLELARARADWERNFDKLEQIYRCLMDLPGGPFSFKIQETKDLPEKEPGVDS